ncbi:contractile injection system protein, VgrG/Pvc8 family [Ostreibacterium oceani]|uniref:Phage late control D family protein n=1 Tax=Ostreibacterium oceani TaxID=2654998 RepID=A0A6N7EZW0_9GAMM|nr:contractile injection system protein, VgrG/Pvc8 family [Ostreibacterium oceani]MPV86899.1 phage late control D family protein [Ostreibacterium oceani]
MVDIPHFELTAGHRHPAWRLSINDRDVTDDLATRIVSLTINDNRGFEADTVSIVLSDHDGVMPVPEHGAVVSVALGWRGVPLIDKGQFIVDAVEHSGAPDILTINAKSADFREALLEKKNISYEKQTLSALIGKIASEYELTPRVSASLTGIQLTHKIQSNESDANLLTRLAIEHDAIATIKNGALLFIAAAEGLSSTGIALPTVAITRTSGDQHSYRMSDRDKFTGVKAYYFDLQAAKKRWVLAGDDTRTTTLKKAYKTADDAEVAAAAELKRLNRGVAALSIRFAYGQPHLFPELPIAVSGFKPAIDAVDWLITKATHTLDEQGLTTSIDCEVKDDQLIGDSAGD